MKSLCLQPLLTFTDVVSPCNGIGRKISFFCFDRFFSSLVQSGLALGSKVIFTLGLFLLTDLLQLPFLGNELHFPERGVVRCYADELSDALYLPGDGAAVEAIGKLVGEGDHRLGRWYCDPEVFPRLTIGHLQGGSDLLASVATAWYRTINLLVTAAIAVVGVRH